MVDRVSRRLTTFSDEREISGSIPVLGCSARRLAGHNLWVRRYGERKQPPFQPQEDAANLRAVNTVVLVLDSMSGFRGRGTRTTTRRTRTDTPSSGRTPDESHPGRVCSAESAPKAQFERTPPTTASVFAKVVISAEGITLSAINHHLSTINPLLNGHSPCGMPAKTGKRRTRHIFVGGSERFADHSHQARLFT